MKRLLLALALIASPAAAQDYVLDNQTFPLFRAELNTILAAIARNNAGTTAPPATFQNMWWIDTDPTTPLWKMRNTANTAWLTLGEIGASAVTWTGGVTTSTADINGGAIDGTVIGGSTAAAGTFSALTSTGNVKITKTAPVLRLDDTNSTAAYRQSALVHTNDAFSVRTYDSADALVSVDYQIDKGASGATEHSWRIEGTEFMELTGGAFILKNTFGDTMFRTATLLSVNYSTTLLPQSASADLGSTSVRWENVFLANSPDVSSDARLKDDIGPPLDAECRAANVIEFKRYRKDGQIHFGAIAQEVEAAFIAEGLDPDDYALVQTGSDGFMSVVYDELQSLKLACM